MRQIRSRRQINLNPQLQPLTRQGMYPEPHTRNIRTHVSTNSMNHRRSTLNYIRPNRQHLNTHTRPVQTRPRIKLSRHQPRRLNRFTNNTTPNGIRLRMTFLHIRRTRHTMNIRSQINPSNHSTRHITLSTYLNNRSNSHNLPVRRQSTNASHSPRHRHNSRYRRSRSSSRNANRSRSNTRQNKVPSKEDSHNGTTPKHNKSQVVHNTTAVRQHSRPNDTTTSHRSTDTRHRTTHLQSELRRTLTKLIRNVTDASANHKDTPTE